MSQFLRFRMVAATCSLVLLGAGVASAQSGEAKPERSGPAYEIPTPGSYELPPITRVNEYELLDIRSEPVPVLGLAPGQAALVSFVYRACPEGHGCPMALAVFKRVDHEIAARPALEGRVVLVTVSFDPARDTPERMAALRRALKPESDWRFLTAEGAAGVQPLLEDFGQDVLPLIDAADRETGVLRHVLKVFLVDSTRAIRNIYSAGFLSAELLMADIETVLLGSEAQVGAKLSP